MMVRWCAKKLPRLKHWIHAKKFLCGSVGPHLDITESLLYFCWTMMSATWKNLPRSCAHIYMILYVQMCISYVSIYVYDICIHTCIERICAMCVLYTVFFLINMHIELYIYIYACVIYSYFLEITMYIYICVCMHICKCICIHIDVQS